MPYTRITSVIPGEGINMPQAANCSQLALFGLIYSEENSQQVEN
jgi:hypothetical protein